MLYPPTREGRGGGREREGRKEGRETAKEGVVTLFKEARPLTPSQCHQCLQVEALRHTARWHSLALRCFSGHKVRTHRGCDGVLCVDLTVACRKDSTHFTVTTVIVIIVIGEDATVITESLESSLVADRFCPLHEPGGHLLSSLLCLLCVVSFPASFGVHPWRDGR